MLRFQRRISVLPGLRLNLSNSGISATVGVRGASVTLGGKRGPALNLGLPGTGLSARVPLSQRRQPPLPKAPSEQNVPPVVPSVKGPEFTPKMTAIGSAPIEHLTS